ncbi:MAG: GNAT family N-acetyltransferase [Bosea sp. (in: a-proteobacteria)]|uniref:GNAT family N-acetyltransferase n=1 Tax=Bosea sp. (in: a-proteobacteria) TaxID=1871050 RepID=UPI0027360ED4|nr:GNAT family N-acetyltransferase [Bosea sp. (in: a-proteobacteria)]MDP3256986.1 GNAT family N-acetyltransferase [Bosea sp. (in: a-proteobacteria)]MDP3321215.1 GNAT family N-acetyltransferase [Bosea sp. (in: a-proteobacteria)]
MSMRRATADDLPAVVALTEAAYLPNEPIIGTPSLPRIADYDTVLAQHEIWLAEGVAGLEGVLVLEEEPNLFGVWSVAVTPASAGRGVGSALMGFAEARARERGFDAIHLYTNAKLADRIAWYERLGYAITHHEDRPNRRLVHMRKPLHKAG